MKLPLLVALVPCAVFAQNFQAMPHLKPILPRLDQPWTRTQPLGKRVIVGPTLIPPGTAVPSHACSIPLLVARPREIDSGMIIPPKVNVESMMPQVQPPAPSCADLPVR
jgi:hypothetical protein